EWLRNGSVDGNVTNNSATLMLPGGYLPRKDARGNPATAPDMATDGMLLAHPDKAAVAGDVRANENIGLTATNTLFAREHNRIVGPLLHAVGDESEYNNDEQIDDTLRSLLFQVPVSGNPNCFDDPSLPNCFTGVTDLGAIDVQRGRDHGMPTYNQLRQALGLPART